MYMSYCFSMLYLLIHFSKELRIPAGLLRRSPPRVKAVPRRSGADARPLDG